MSETDSTPDARDQIPQTFWGKALLVAKTVQARLRFIAVLAVIGLAISYWDTLSAWYEKWTRPSGAPAAGAGDTEYFCPMHPQIVRDNPKDPCPICFMPLSRRSKSRHPAAPLPAGTLARVQLSPYRIVLGGIQTAPLARQSLEKEIRTVGFVEFDERKLAQIAARVKGRLDKVFVNVTGQKVDAGEPLALLYSPELLVTANSLLEARRGGNEELVRSSRERLRLWDIREAQIDEILRLGKANTLLEIRSPISGHVIKKYQTEGKYIEEGMPLYDVADLSTVWIQAQVYEQDIAFLAVGMTAFAASPALPNRDFQGRLSFIHPHLDQASRTLTVRFDIANPAHELRPGMYANVRIEVPMERILGTSPADGKKATAAGGLLAVPESAVIDTGTRKVVYKEVAPGTFDGVEVKLGPRAGGYYPLLEGLAEGDRLVLNGAFLIDAETRLNPAAGSIYFGGAGGNKPTSAPGPMTSQPPSNDEDREIAAERGKLAPADRRLADQQDYCPIQKDNRLGMMGKPHKILLAGEPVFLCCKGCEAEARKAPAQTLAKVRELRSKKASERSRP